MSDPILIRGAGAIGGTLGAAWRGRDATFSASTGPPTTLRR